MQVLCISVGLAFHIQIMVQDIHIVIQSEEAKTCRTKSKMRGKEESI